MAAGGSVLKLYNGCTIPQVGLGTWKSKPGQVEAAVYHAIKSGYRHIDCARVYGNEAEVGNGLARAIKEGIVKRKELWVTSKLWNNFHHEEHVMEGLNQTLKDLQLEYLDLFLIHWPTAFKCDTQNLFPKDIHGNMLYPEDDEKGPINFLRTWPVMKKAVDEKKIRNIGLSNFNSKQIKAVMDLNLVKPAMLQVECHPYCIQENLRKFCTENEILFTGYSPLGSPDRPWANADDPSLLDDPKLAEIGKKYNKTSAQVLIRWQIDHGLCVIPKSVTPSRIEENFNVLDFKLSEEDMKTIDSFNRNWHGCVPRITVDGKLVARDGKHPQFPFGVDEDYTF